MRKVDEFIQRLKALEDEFGIKVEQSCSADDDSNLQGWIEYVEYIHEPKKWSKRIVLHIDYDR